MKTGIITLHHSYSFGACLQAYATYSAVRRMGHDVYMIDYVNRFEQDQNRLVSGKFGKSPVKCLKNTLENILLFRSLNLKRSFSAFHNIYPKTDRYDDLDCLISGSDQLWNPDIFDGTDKMYYLDFGKEDCRRISYAASAGSHIFSEKEADIIRPLLMRYDAVSVRESSLGRQIRDITGKTAKLVLDPTFLLSGEEWISLSESRAEKNYILLYMIGVPYKKYKEIYAPVVRRFKEKTGLPVYAVNSMSFFKYQYSDKNLNGLTPFELLGAINNAELIITSSFHGVALSINLNKNFVALKTDNPERTACLLDTAGLTDRLIDGRGEDNCGRLTEKIDYNAVKAVISEKRADSLNWLRENIGLE